MNEIEKSNRRVEMSAVLSNVVKNLKCHNVRNSRS